MKIGIVIWDLTVSGGTQRQAIELARALSSRHEVAIYSYAYNQAKCFPELTDGLTIAALADTIPAFPKRPSGKLAQFWYDSYGQFWLFDEQIRALANNIPIDLEVVNVHDTFTDRVGFYYKQRSPKTKLVWMSNDSPAVFLNIDHDRTKQTSVAEYLTHPLRLVQRGLYALAVRQGRRYVAAMDSVVVLDHRNKRQVDELMHHTAVVVRSGLAIDKFTPAPKQHHDEFQILGTGILFRHRRFEDLITAVGLLQKAGKPVHLNIIGKPTFDPGYAQELTDLVAKLGLGQLVSFLGTVSEEELLRQYRESDVFVFPNNKQTWGLAVFEAMASGTPVIVSRGAGAHEVLTDGENALLVDPLQPQQIADKVTQLMDNPDLAPALIKHGREYVEQNITWTMYAKNMEAVFRGDLKA